MKKGYYIHFQGRASIGISKKIDMQMEEFKKHCNIDELEVETYERTLCQRLLGLFPTASIARNYQKALEELKDPDFLYVRRAVADKAYVRFWKEVRRKYPDCKIIIEIFTYPYDKDDFAKWNAWPFYIKEIMYRRKLKNYVNRFVTYSLDKEIFGIPTICTTNGINVEKIQRINGNYEEKKIVLLGVAYMQRQHGYERIINGLRDYYRGMSISYKVYLYLVGDGPEKIKYQELVKKYHLQEYVKFYPITTGKELDALYDVSDIALGAFGMYKVGFDAPVGALKTRECLAKGIPLISGSPIDVLDDNFAFARIFPNDNSVVNVSQIIEFYELIQKTGLGKMEIADKIREYAKEHVSMSVVMKPIIDYIEQ